MAASISRYGLDWRVVGALWEGYPTYLMAPASFVQRPLRWLQAISRYRGTVGGGPNFAYQLCVDAAKSADTSNLDLSSWRLAWNGAEPVRADTMEKFLAVFAPCGLRPQILTPTFGLAEATLVVTGDSGSSHYLDMHVDDVLLRENRVEPCAAEHRHARHLVSSGKPGQNVTVRIVDPDTFRELASDQVGEIWVAGPSVAKGYFNKPEETRDIFGAFTADPVAGPFLRTGDLGVSRRAKPASDRQVKTSHFEKGNIRPRGLQRRVPRKEAENGECSQDGADRVDFIVTCAAVVPAADRS